MPVEPLLAKPTATLTRLIVMHGIGTKPDTTLGIAVLRFVV